MRTPDLSQRRFARLLALVVLLGLALRLDGLTARGFSHPENYVPGVDLPDWTLIKDRSSLRGLLEGMLRDGHPPGWFLLMFAWTKLCGASLFALRLPAALLGAACAWLVARLALREGGRWTALLAALLVALHGYHVYWSQAARMYALVAFLALLSSLWLRRIHEDGKRSSHVQYVLWTTALLWTQMFGWALVFGQLVWCAWRTFEGRPWSALRAQALAIALAAPALQLAAFQANPEWSWHEPAAEYFEFGYLFLSRHPFFGEPPFELHGIWLILICVAALVGGAATRAAAKVRKARGGSARNGPGWSPLVEVTLALLTAVAMWIAARYVYWERPTIAKGTLYVFAAYPVAVVLAAFFVTRLADGVTLRRNAARPVDDAGITLSFVLAVAPFSLILAVSTFGQGILVARGTLTFLPFLILAVAGGIGRLGHTSPPFGLGLAAGLVALFATSLPYHRAAASCPQDFRGLALEMSARFEPADLVFVRNDTMHPPLYFYWKGEFERLVTADYAHVASEAPDATRIWIVHIHDQPVWEEMTAAVAAWERTATVERPGIEAWLYERSR